MANTAVWVTIGIYIAVIVIIGISAGRKSKNVADLTVGGRSAGAWLSALSYGTAYFSAVMFVGYAGGTGKSFGLWGIAAGIGNAVFGAYLAWKLLARKTRDISGRLKIKTMPEFFEKRYGSAKLKTFAAIVIFVFLVPYSASVYKGIASVAEVLLGIPNSVCMIIIAVMAMLLLVLGGYLVQARADFFQGIVMMGGVTLLIIYVIKSGPVGGFAGIAQYAKTPLGLPKLSSSQAVSLMATVLMTSFGTWGLPQMVQKFFGIKDDKQAKRGISISTFFCMLIAGGGYFIGSLCYMFFTKETLPAQDYIVPEMLARVGLPSVLMGVVLVLLLSASVSTLCSVSLTACSILSIDLIRPNTKTEITDKNAANLTKILCAVFVVMSYIVANTDTPILDMMSYSWGIISGSFLAPYMLALYRKKMNLKSAWSGVITGFVIALFPAACRILTICGSTADAVVSLAGKGPVFACAAMIASIIVCLIVSSATAEKEIPENIEFFYNGIVEKE
ncbi:MAG: sodium:solute symporter family protein [Clostridiales bacterium]|nr:sodium:solute symporter family protein [Clostridiales bacterium]